MSRKFLTVCAVLVLAALPCLAQSNPTATLTGKVVTADGAPLPGVTVTVSSSRLQGTRTVVTTIAGDYIIPFLPPGQYEVTFELAGMQSVERRAALSASRTERMDVKMGLETVTAAITVTADVPMSAVIDSTNVTTNFSQDLVEALPVARTLESVTLLAPGVNPNGPNDNIIISGAMSFDSLYLINGAIVNENLRGQPHDVFIEDAIQETAVMTAGISAEYGHFTGGVVSAVTKSGGNEFEGSARASLTNESWTEKTPLTVDQEDNINEVYEATFGGPIWRDRVWFFSAGRDNSTSDLRQTSPGSPKTGDINNTPITYPHGFDETRLEGKLTGALTPRHNVVVSYLDVDAVEQNNHFGTILDLGPLNPERETPNTLLTLNYSGVLTDNVFVEALYSEKDFSFIGSGGRCSDLICGTLLLDRSRGSRRYHAPTFKYKPEGEKRNNDNLAIKGSYFLSTDQYGSHELRVGLEQFSELRLVNNNQSGSDHRIYTTGAIIRDNVVYPRVRSGTSTRIYYQPIETPSIGADYAVDSVFINDRWTFDDHWAFNVGLRYDKNDTVSADGSFKISDDSAFSPRLGAHYDLWGDGRLVFNASYSQYAGRMQEGVGNDGDPGGRNSSYTWYYRGPGINTDVNAPTSELIGQDEVIQMIFDWFFANGGYDMRPYRSVSKPGVSTILDPGGLSSPNVQEYVLGVGARIGNGGYVRADLIFRDWENFYHDVRDLTTGTTTDGVNTFDLGIVRTEGSPYKREYTGLQTQFNYRLSTRFNVGGTYTWSRLVGNVTGESSSSGPVSGSAMEYPEYREESWNYPTGYLTGDQRHRLRAWASYDLPTSFGDFNFSLLQNFDSGTRTSTDFTVDTRDFVDNPGYVRPTSGVSYFVNGRGDLKHDDITRTDLAINYKFRFGKLLELSIQPEILNLFDEQGVLSFNETIVTSEDEDYLSPFNPFTETPIECPQGASAQTCMDMGANWQKGEQFGEPTTEGSYQRPRTFRVSIVLRF